MAEGYSVVNDLLGANAETHGELALVSATIVIAVVLLLGVVARLNLKPDRLVPDKSFTIRNIFEIVSGFVIWLGDSAMGKENRKYLPFLASLFFYILAMNLLGLVPGFVMPTDVFQFNLGVALSVFVLYCYWGMRDGGVGHFLKHLCGPVWWLAPLMLPIELISHSVRPLTLSLRLFGNMTGDHLALSIFSGLTKGTPVFWIPIVFYVLGTVVALIQAFVFTLLAMIYIRLAVAHEEN